jgi:hypothetical protein
MKYMQAKANCMDRIGMNGMKGAKQQNLSTEKEKPIYNED